MRVGTLLDMFRVLPGLIHNCFDRDAEMRSTIWWLEKHAPAFVRGYAAYLLGLRREKGGLSREHLFELFDPRNHVGECRSAGARHFEIFGDLVLLNDEIRKWAQSHILPHLISLKKDGVTYSVHVPQFAGLFIESFMPGVQQGVIADFRDMVLFFEPLDPFYVLHLGSERFFRYLSSHGSDPARDQEIDRTFCAERNPLKRFLKKKAARYAALDITRFIQGFVCNKVVAPNALRSLEEINKFLPVEKICLENLEFTDPDAVMPPILSRSNVSMLLDVGHLMIQKWSRNKLCFEEYFEKYGERLRGLHVHNVVEVAKEVYDKKTSVPELQDHKPLDVKGGLLPLQKILRLVKNLERRTGRELPLIIELYYHDPIPSIRILNKMIAEL